MAAPPTARATAPRTVTRTESGSVSLRRPAHQQPHGVGGTGAPRRAGRRGARHRTAAEPSMALAQPSGAGHPRGLANASGILARGAPRLKVYGSSADAAMCPPSLNGPCTSLVSTAKSALTSTSCSPRLSSSGSTYPEIVKVPVAPVRSKSCPSACALPSSATRLAVPVKQNEAPSSAPVHASSEMMNVAGSILALSSDTRIVAGPAFTSEYVRWIGSDSEVESSKARPSRSLSFAGQRPLND
mmetsp:Transcript_2638/g.6928  ORF Transcript_2638/g.6928 Transcript_2638/m.6928 type:complete len:243 (-) Transcript_2638:264-992(-)